MFDNPPITSYSLRVGLFHEAKEVRAAVLRVLRYFLQESETVDLLYSLHIDYLIVRFVTCMYLEMNSKGTQFILSINWVGAVYA